jgi:hypothetical protein
MPQRPQQRRQCRDDEGRAPADTRLEKAAEIRRHHKAERRTHLDIGGVAGTAGRRHAFGDETLSRAPFAANPKPGKRTKREKFDQRMRRRTQRRAYPVDQH